MSGLLFDTHVMIYWLKGDRRIPALAQEFDEKFISFITEIELLANPNGNPAERRFIRNFLQDFRPLHLPTDAQRLAELKSLGADLKRQHKKLSFADAIIGATAKVHDLRLLTADLGLWKADESRHIYFDPTAY